MNSGRKLALGLLALCVVSAALGFKTALVWAENKPVTIRMACAVTSPEGEILSYRSITFVLTRTPTGWSAEDRPATEIDEVCVPREIIKW